MQEMQEIRVPSLGQEDPLEKGMATTPLFLPEEAHGQRRSLAGYSPCGHKESDRTEATEHAWMQTAARQASLAFTISQFAQIHIR